MPGWMVGVYQSEHLVNPIKYVRYCALTSRSRIAHFVRWAASIGVCFALYTLLVSAY